MSQRSERRPVLAAMLSFVQPGVGHLYLREWLRAVLWGMMWLGSLLTVISTVDLELSATETVAAVAGLFALVEGFPTEGVVAMVAVALFATMDAYWLASRNNRRLARDRRSCPHCGRDLDPTLEFCHWCTTPLESEESA